MQWNQPSIMLVVELILRITGLKDRNGVKYVQEPFHMSVINLGALRNKAA